MKHIKLFIAFFLTTVGVHAASTPRFFKNSSLRNRLSRIVEQGKFIVHCTSFAVIHAYTQAISSGLQGSSAVYAAGARLAADIYSTKFVQSFLYGQRVMAHQPKNGPSAV